MKMAEGYVSGTHLMLKWLMKIVKKLLGGPPAEWHSNCEASSLKPICYGECFGQFFANFVGLALSRSLNKRLSEIWQWRKHLNKDKINIVFEVAYDK
jgi:hypothetical protein